ncbi:sialidase family protein [Nonomuraea thailandensis]
MPLTELASDTYANSTGQYGTSAGPDTYQWDSTIVTAQQAGRFHDGGASGITFATSTDNGGTWTKGTLPAITTFGGGPYGRVSDPSVAFDAEHGAWLITSLALTDAGGVTGAAVLTSRSTDGGLTWSTPVTIATGGDPDKSWAVCDNGADSAFRGTCYAVFDDHAAGNAVKVARSSDGGLTWAVTGTSANGLGGQPVVRPDGAVVVPYLGDGGEIRSFRSSDGGASWGASVLVSRVQRHTVAGGLRAAPLPSAEVDAAGTVYVVWQDCRFQVTCAGNDIVLSTSATGATWGEVLRVTEDGGDHFIPGLGVDRASSGKGRGWRWPTTATPTPPARPRPAGSRSPTPPPPTAARAGRRRWSCTRACHWTGWPTARRAARWATTSPPRSCRAAPPSRRSRWRGRRRAGRSTCGRTRSRGPARLGRGAAHDRHRGGRRQRRTPAGALATAR